MTAKKDPISFSNFGFSTILLSFVMICVLTFSVLTLVTANSDYKLSKKVADKNQAFYGAQEQAYEKLNTLETMFINSYFSTHSEEDYLKQIESESPEFGTFLTSADGYYILYEEPIAPDQYLSVKLKIKYPKENSHTFFEIVEWKSIYIKELPEESFLDLIQ